MNINLDFGDGLLFGLGLICAKGFVELLKLLCIVLFYEKGST
jgi:hypothetical protein